MTPLSQVGAFLLCAEKLPCLLGPLAGCFPSPPLVASTDSVDPSPAPGLPSLAWDPGVAEDVIWVPGCEGAVLTCHVKTRPSVPPLSQTVHFLLKKGLFSVSSG